MLGDYEDLALSLGADLDAPDIAADRERYAAAVEGFESSLAAKPDLTVLAVSPTPELLYVAVPEYSAELSDFVRWGMQLVVPDNPGVRHPIWGQAEQRTTSSRAGVRFATSAWSDRR